jgi:hypothetical protein
MDRIQQLNYEKDFRIAFLETKGADSTVIWPPIP